MIKSGDLVRRKGTVGPLMAVDFMLIDGMTANCMWYDTVDGNVCRVELFVEQLEKVEDERKQG